MSTVTATPMRGQPPFLAPARTIDRSTEQPMPDYGEPILSPTGLPDELSASYVRAYAAAYRKAHAEADAAEEAESLRNELAARDWTPEQFHAHLREHCPGLTATCSGIAYVHVDCFPDQPPASERYEARAKFPDGSPLRHVEAASWRELGERLALEYATRRGIVGVAAVLGTAAAVGAE